MMCSGCAMPMLADFDVGDILKTLIALLVVASGILGSVLKTKKDDEAAKKSVPPEKPKPKARPQYPTAQPMPGEPVLSPRQAPSPTMEQPRRPVLVRPTAPPVIAESPVPTIRRTVSPRPQPVQPTQVPRSPRTVEPGRRVAAEHERDTARRSPPRRVVVRQAQPGREGQRRAASTVVSTTKRKVLEAEPAAGPERVATEPVAGSFRLTITSREGLRTAFILSEIIGPPLALRPPDSPGW